MANDFKNAKEFLIKYGNSVEQEIEKRLYNAGKYATGKLYESIRYEVKREKDVFFLKFLMADYGVFVDKGVKPQPQYLKGKGTGKSKFITALKKWCKVKGIPENAAFPIRRSIWKNGIKPTNFFTIPTTRRKKQLIEGLKKAMSKDVKKSILDGINNT
jgi:hypothetical protein